MAQFDVYLNPNPGSRSFVPYVIDVQSSLIDLLPTRLVMPLSRVGADQAKLPVNLAPTVEVEGEGLTLMAHLAAPVSARLLKKPVMSLAHRAHEVSAALDVVISGF
ncbi:MAG: plasmid maintenance protein CcdB [Burkholderiales bacterium]|nr:MAG: plasmid maintenance protein CcdB [Burkholderiales bacterium]